MIVDEFVVVWIEEFCVDCVGEVLGGGEVGILFFGVVRGDEVIVEYILG